MPDLNQYWCFLIVGQADDNTGLVGNYYAYGQHCGEALANALHAAAENDFLNPVATEASRLDTLQDFEEPDNLLTLSDLVLTGPTNYSFPLDTAKKFIPPIGIINSVDEGQFDYELIQESFWAYKPEGSNMFEFELVTAQANTIKTFIEAISFIPNADSLEIRIKGHWSNTDTESWVSRNLDNAKDIRLFLIQNQANTTENGFVECVIKLEQGETSLVLDEHKKICLRTSDEEIFSSFGQNIIALGFVQVTELHSLEYGFYHWHYRPAESLDRLDFRVLLTNHGFELVDSWDDSDEMVY